MACVSHWWIYAIMGLAAVCCVILTGLAMIEERRVRRHIRDNS
jgi:uncharacterized membrane protein YuzA (DUF378 family)